LRVSRAAWAQPAWSFLFDKIPFHCRSARWIMLNA
jgi:hypothetical protein